MRLLLVLVLLPLAVAARGQVWVQQGPGPNTHGEVEGATIPDGDVAGAVQAIAVHPVNPDVIYAGAVNGGIWKTGNGTLRSPSWVEQLGLGRSLSIGSLAFDPTDASHETLLAGSAITSSFQGVGGAQVGVWYTTNGGADWTLLSGRGALQGLNIVGVAPRGRTMVIAANNGGVWRSTDTGATWTKTSGAAGSGLPAGASFDLAGNASTPARLFTNAGSDGIYRSLDTGATWRKVSNDAMHRVLTSGNLFNVRIAVGTQNDVYAAIVISGQLAGLFRSGDGGDSWTELDRPTTTEQNNVVVGIHPGFQGGIDMSIAAHPTSPNVVFVGGDRQPCRNTATMSDCFPNSIGATEFTGRLFRVDASLPRGRQATPITHVNTEHNSAPHADSRGLAFDANGDLLDADDGGVYRRTQPLSSAGDWFPVIGDLKVTEFHSIAWDSNSRLAFGGAQDTGSPEQLTPGGFRWNSINKGDGGVVAVDSTGTPGRSVRYASTVSLSNFTRGTYDAAGVRIAETAPALRVVARGAPFVRGRGYTPICLNNVQPHRLVIGAANSLYESPNQGDTIREIGPGIVVNPNVSNPIDCGATGNPHALYLGSDRSVFVRMRRPDAPAKSASYPGKERVLDVAIHRHDPRTAFVVDASHVYATRDAGRSWQDVTGNLLSLDPGQLRSVAFSTSRTLGGVVAGTDKGVYIASPPAFSSWRALGTGLPGAPVFGLVYDPRSELLAAGLMGRGAWTIGMGPAKEVQP
ncbi:MAG TPA: hypothetical protein VFP80_09980 [Thermoanaerobaculia bacterium]|nr:hypothetical protein [Thermoanaerobaculia bacterium]